MKRRRPCGRCSRSPQPSSVAGPRARRSESLVHDRERRVRVEQPAPERRSGARAADREGPMAARSRQNRDVAFPGFRNRTGVEVAYISVDVGEGRKNDLPLLEGQLAFWRDVRSRAVVALHEVDGKEGAEAPDRVIAEQVLIEVEVDEGTVNDRE